MAAPVELHNIDFSSVMHPDDRSVISKINKVPGFKAFLSDTVGAVRESYNEVEYSGDGVDVNERSMPRIAYLLKDTARILGVTDIPACSTDWLYAISSCSAGIKKRRIVLLSGTTDLLDDAELKFIIAHEIGHFECGHKPYHMTLETLYMPLVNDVDAKLIATLIKLPLLEWFRYSDYSADRVGLLACQDINIALKTMIKMSGLPKKCYDEININAFIQQAREFEHEHSGFINNATRALTIRSAFSPWLVLRAAKLLEWYESGEYSRILNQYGQGERYWFRQLR